MPQFFNTMLTSLDLLRANILLVLNLIAVLWVIHFLNWVGRYRLSLLGIHPRKFFGLIGIPFSPLLHQDFRHLFLNSIPLFILLSFIFLYGQQVAFQLTLCIVILGGLGIWIFARKGIHIGASTLVMGYFGFIMAIACHTRNPLAIVIAAVCLFYLGGLIGGLFPSRDRTSWEGHLAGFMAGLVYAFIL